MKDFLDKLSKINSFSGRVKLCSDNFKKLRAGSSRVVFDIGSVAPGMVLKLAKNEKGRVQNRTESDGFIQQNYSDIVAKVADSDPEDYWVIVEKVDKISPSQFKSLTGVSFEDFSNYIKGFFNYKQNIPYDKSLGDNDFVAEVADLVGNFRLLTGDIARIGSWGQTNNRAVLLDYGLTEDDYDTLYRKSSVVNELLKTAEKFEEMIDNEV